MEKLALASTAKHLIDLSVSAATRLDNVDPTANVLKQLFMFSLPKYGEIKISENQLPWFMLRNTLNMYNRA